MSVHLAVIAAVWSGVSASAVGRPGAASFSLASVIGDDMVLPAAPALARVWGAGCMAGANVSVSLAGHNGTWRASPAPSGAWKVELGALTASVVPRNLTVTCGTSPAQVVVAARVLVGDIILCGGQSNMQFSLRDAFNGSAEIADAGRYGATLRLLTVARETAAAPLPSVPLQQPWTVSSPAAVDDGKSFGLFSATCYLAGRRLLLRNPGRPIGLVSSCWSGSMIQPFMSPAALAACPAAVARGRGDPFLDSARYNAMIAPLLPLQVAAVLWHQGEENAGNPVEYGCFFRSLVADWRAGFGDAGLPFAFVSLQPCNIPPAMRHAQASALSLPRVGMAPAFDLGDPSPSNPNGMCHTRYKEEIGARLAAVVAPLMRNNASASQPAPAVSGPPVATHVVGVAAKDYRTYVATIAVRGGGDGLVLNGTKQCSACCAAPSYIMSYASTAPGEHWQGIGTKPGKHGTPVVFDAEAQTLVVTFVIEPPFKPAALRYAWADFPQCALFTRAADDSGTPLPLSPFNFSLPEPSSPPPHPHADL